MASLESAVPGVGAPIVGTADLGARVDGPRGGFRGGRVGREPQQNPRGSGFRGGRRGRGGARGNRGDSNSNHNGHGHGHGHGHSNSTHQPAPPIPPPPGLGGGGSFGGRLTKDAETKEGEVLIREQDSKEEDVEAEVCFICASPVVHNSVAPCNHRTCHICALRMRALYKTKACAHCRTEAKYVVFTDDAARRFEDFVEADFTEIDETLGIKYEQKEIHNDTLLLLRYNCPDLTCDIACWGWPDLHRHVKNVHHKVLCDLCTRNKKVFTHEHELFTIQELRKHEKFGDDNPGAVDQSGFKGHPECGFCRERFYGTDELYAHCRDKHEKCHICDRRNYGREQQYYVDYDSLERHFRKDHFVCADQECLDKKFVVFESEMDLKAHQLEFHPNGLSKDARKDARRVDISAFDYRTPHQDNRGGRREREGRRNGPGRDPNSEALPHSTAQPLRRDELAFQRQMAIQSAQSVSTRTFGGSLTSTDAYAARSNGRGPEPTVTASRGHGAPTAPLPALESLNITSTPNPPASPVTNHALTPQEQARRLQHAAVMDRASGMLKNDQTKLADFRSSVSSYRTSALSASQLIDTFFLLFDVSAADLGKLIKELADIYENEAKRNDLLKAWNDWRAINEDYPSLPGPSGVLPGSSAAAAGSGGHRVLKLKSSTAQSSRSAVSKQGSWGHAASAVAFPAMPASANRVGAGRVSATPWVNSSARPSPASSRPTSRPPSSRQADAVGSDAFPALPAAAKPNTSIFGLTRGTVRWDDGRSGPPSAAWGSASSNKDTSKEVIEAERDSNSTAEFAKKKGGKPKKQTLYKFG